MDLLCPGALCMTVMLPGSTMIQKVTLKRTQLEAWVNFLPCVSAFLLTFIFHVCYGAHPLVCHVQALVRVRMACHVQALLGSLLCRALFALVGCD